MTRALALCGLLLLLGGCSTAVEQDTKRTSEATPVKPVRAVQVDLDYVYDENPAQEASNLDALVVRMRALRVNTIFLQAFADPKGTGLASALYFPNRHLPMRKDLFKHVAQELASRADVEVYGWLPVLSFDFKGDVAPVLAWNPGSDEAKRDAKAYRRVSPFDEKGRKRIAEIYEDLAENAPIKGLLFHDDALLSDFEDASEPALKAYEAAGLPPSIRTIRDNPDLMQRWTDYKTSSLISFTHELASRARQYRDPLKTARNIYAPIALIPARETWFAQNYGRFCEAYDYTAVMAMPALENIPDAEANAWLRKLVSAASHQPEGLNRTIFELQTVDWRKGERDANRSIPPARIAAQMRLLLDHGAINLAYYPDDFIRDRPSTIALNQEFSPPTD